LNTVRDTLRKLAPVVGSARVNELWRVYLASDMDDQRELERILEAQAANLLNEDAAGSPAGLFPPPPPERAIGSLDLGRIKYGGRTTHLFGLRTEELLRHVGLYGSSGSGKSNGIALILDGLTREKVPFMLVDFKRTFRALLKDYAKILVFAAGDSHTAPFQFNPLIPPPGTPVDVWLKKVVGAVSHAYMQGAGSESLLISALEEAYNKAGAQKRWPTFKDVAVTLDAQPARGRKGMWLDSARRAVGSLTSGNAAEVFCPAHPIDFARLLRESVILEMDLLNPSEQCCLSECLLLWVIQYRMHNNENREVLQHVIVIEEAHHLLRAPPGVGDGSEPVMHIALREVRELGESIILATQNASVVPVSVFGNQATTIAFHTKHASDVRATSQAMLLKDDAKDELGRLPVGDAIVRVARFPDPVHIVLNYRPIAKGTVSDLDIRQHMHSRWYSANTGTFRSPEPELSPSRALPAHDERQVRPTESPSQEATTIQAVVTVSPTTTPKDEQARPVLEEPSPLELAMLTDIVAQPFDGVVRRIHRLQSSRRKGVAALQALEQRGIIKPANIFTGTSILKLYDLTKDGRAFCRQYGIGPLAETTAGGIEHRYVIHEAATHLTAEGWTVKIEYHVSNDLIVDIYAQKERKTIAVLVETGKSNIQKNISRTKLAGFDEVRVIPSHRRQPILNTKHFE